MKLNRRLNKKFNKTTILLLAVMFIGLGFAALSATLGITGHAIIGNISFDVHFANVEVKEGSMEAQSPATIDASDKTQINFSLHLTTPGQFYEFETDIVNNGTLDAYLSSIELLGLDETTKKYLNVTYRYVPGGKIRINDLLKSGETERIKVKVDFLYDITLDDLPSEEKSIDFTLNLTYTQDNGTGVERDKSEIVVDILGQDMIAYIDNVKSKYVSSEKGINFWYASSDTNGKGLYLRAGTEYDKYPIFYLRGEVDNNHVLFGGFCWKIVRTTEQGGTKLIYNGLPDSNNQCNNTGESSQLSTKSVFNIKNYASADVGYMYGTRYEFDTSSSNTTTKWEDSDYPYIYGSDVTYSDGAYTLTNTSSSDTIANVKTKHYTCKSITDISCDTVYYVYSYYNGKDFAIELTNGDKLDSIINKSNVNENDSAMKITLNTWFASNLAGQESKLEDAVWCNDRSIASGGYLVDFDLTRYSSNGATYFDVYARNVNSYFFPGLKDEEACINQNDRFTVNDTKVGNGLLKYPVGLLTADETRVAGNGYNGYSDKTYLCNGQSYWTISPRSVAGAGHSSSVFVVGSSGFLSDSDVTISRGVRPVVVLKKGIVAVSGDGTSTNPYVVG